MQRYFDPCYGEWELPPVISELIRCKKLIRLKNISMGVMPNFLLPGYALPSRFHHGLGVAYLAKCVCEENTFEDESFALLLLVSALLHDAGSTCFSHLGEYFLKQEFGKDGEQFLERVLQGDEIARVLKKYGIAARDVLAMVTGKHPLSAVLNGSMDIDNLDNVYRYGRAIGKEPLFHPVYLAKAFRFKNEKWFLDAWYYFGKRDCHIADAIGRWIKARSEVYQTIYSDQTLIPRQMLERAVNLLYQTRGGLGESFYLLDDADAFQYLLSSGVPEVERLCDHLLRWKMYENVYELITTNPPARLVKLCEDPLARTKLADRLCEEFELEPDYLCVYVGKGRDGKKIDIPYVLGEGDTGFTYTPTDVYRIKVFVREDCKNLKEKIREFIEE